MLYWIWRFLWWPPRHVEGTSRWRQLKRLGELEQRVDAMESRVNKLQGRVTGGIRSGDLIDDPEDDLELELDESRSLGATTRWGKS